MRWLVLLGYIAACDEPLAEAARFERAAPSGSQMVPTRALSSSSTRPTAVVSVRPTSAPSATAEAQPWGPSTAGVIRRLPHAGEARIALTLDACGGPGGDDYDAELIALLEREQVPATLFVTARWIRAQPEVAQKLAELPLFDVENHGSEHLPCTVSGREAFGITGPASVEAAKREIVGGRRAVAGLTGTEPRFYRPGTGFFEPACVGLVRELGALPLGFTVAGDAGGSFPRSRIARSVANAPAGAIVLLHMNQPDRDVAEGLSDALPALRERGVKFVRLSEVWAP